MAFLRSGYVLARSYHDVLMMEFQRVASASWHGKVERAHSLPEIEFRGSQKQLNYIPNWFYPWAHRSGTLGCECRGVGLGEGRCVKKEGGRREGGHWLKSMRAEKGRQETGCGKKQEGGYLKGEGRERRAKGRVYSHHLKTSRFQILKQQRPISGQLKGLCRPLWGPWLGL